MKEQLALPEPSAEVLSRYSIDTSEGPVGVELSQTSTRVSSPGEFVLTGELFDRDSINWDKAKEHVLIHQSGDVAGSQFNGDVFESPDEIVSFMTAILPESISYDQAGRAELTVDVDTPNKLSLGYTGVKSIEELSGMDGVEMEKAIRNPGGEPAEVEGVRGAWYPETTRNPETGRFDVVTNPDGSVKNPHGKFEPEATIATVSDPNAFETSKATVVIQKDQDGQPTVLTMFPGDNAPAAPTLIDTEGFKLNTLQGPSAEYWDQHAFVKAA